MACTSSVCTIMPVSAPRATQMKDAHDMHEELVNSLSQGPDSCVQLRTAQILRQQLVQDEK
eukprot:1156288-Pelagomonas_calceolata.AAC.5